jgi:hypothetical protein
MSTTYPAQIDTNQSLPTVVDNLTPVYGKVFNQLRDAVIAIEATLGAQANGIYTSVGARIANLENIVGNLQIISLSQDIGGTLGSPLIVGIQGRPVSDAGPLNNEVLTWNGIAWVPSPPTGLIDVILACDLSGTKLCQIVVGIQGNPVASTAPVEGQFLQWTDTEWAPGPATPTYSGEFMLWNGTTWVAGPATAPTTGQILQWNGSVWVPVNLTAPPGPANANLKQLVAGNFTTNSSTPIRIGATDIDMSFYPSVSGGFNLTATFYALIEVTTTSATAEIQLVDVTHNVVITGTIGSTTQASGLYLFSSGPLTVGTSAGNIRTDAVTIYEAQLSMTTGNPVTDRAICANARVELTYS